MKQDAMIGWRCRLFGHAGRWGEARTDGMLWHSHCRRCDAPVVRPCRSDAAWRSADEAIGV